jgi:hypothetical protein
LFRSKPGLVPGFFMAGIQYTADSKEASLFKLSRKGWNNVIIVVVLIVITLLHRLEQAQQENSAKRARPLLPESAVVPTWQGRAGR